MRYAVAAFVVYHVASTTIILIGATMYFWRLWRFAYKLAHGRDFLQNLCDNLFSTR